MFGFLIPRNYIEALEFDKGNINSKWYDATKAELDSILSYEVFQKHEKAEYDKEKKVSNAPPGNRILSKVQKSFWSCTHVNSCQKYELYINLHIVLNILSKATPNIQESRKSIKFLKR